MIYAGIGSRETPHDTLEVMKRIGAHYAYHDYILRSGGAKGADQAFEFHVPAHLKQIFYARDATAEAIQYASHFHPAWDRCNEYARQLHGRNAMIILGATLDRPVDAVVCWTKDGTDVGGTGLGMRIAKANDIQIYNLFSYRGFDQL